MAEVVAPATFAFEFIEKNSTTSPAFTLSCPLRTAANISMSDGGGDIGAVIRAQFRYLSCNLTLVEVSHYLAIGKHSPLCH